MKFCVALIAVCAVFAVAAAVPAGRNQVMYFQQHRPLRQQAMLVHRYHAPKYASRRSSQEVGAFASGDSIEGATFIQDEQPALQDGDAFSVAEAYPSEADDASALQAADDIAAGAENDVYQPENEEFPQADAPVVAPVAPVAPQQDAPPKKSNKKKVAAAAPALAAAAEESDDADDEFVPSLTKAGRPSAGGAAGLPHTFFPMNFGSTSGGAIAVANSFSTGKGSAASHAVAYGSAASKKRRND